MMVTFVSECEKKALPKTRRVLDAFANRIGSRTWQTVITEEGLAAVRKLLRRTASKNTAVSCHWIRSRSRSELIWIVGNRGKFDLQGKVPVNSTKQTVFSSHWENDWHYLPLIKALAAMAALFHDWGKASEFFQEKLAKNKIIGDPLRHEWISLLFLNVYINEGGKESSDEDWLVRLAKGDIGSETLRSMGYYKKQAEILKKKPLAQLPNAATMVAWLIVSHHRLPLLNDAQKRSERSFRDKSLPLLDIQKLFKVITQKWGYENHFDDTEFVEGLSQCFSYKNGLPCDSKAWLVYAQKTASKLLDCLPLLEAALENGSWRLILNQARLVLMLGDHYYSSLPASSQWKSDLKLYANTDRDVAGKIKPFKQRLDEHLVGVAKQAVKTAQLLPAFEGKKAELQRAYDVATLKKKSPNKFRWQDTAVSKIAAWRCNQEKLDVDHFGFFAVNMASTGKGKTFANAKIMRALSPQMDSLRFILALGLRTLTLQTGDEYRERIGLGNDELAVLIGSRAVLSLHNKDSREAGEAVINDYGSESLEALLDNEIHFESTIPQSDFKTVISSKKEQKFLYAPVLSCTVDHMMAATETKRGGRYILPTLRLMSSDLVIDEVDDFDGKDLIAIGRLIHLAGMLGRKVMISSATIPPDLAEGYYNAYQAGWSIFATTRNIHSAMGCAWVDEFGTQVVTIEENGEGNGRTDYQSAHEKFVKKRVKKLSVEKVKRKATIIPCSQVGGESETEQHAYEAIQSAILQKHSQHCVLDERTNKQVSFGVVRVANVKPCIDLTRYLLAGQWPDDTEVRVMAYHSQQILLMRSAQEKHLDSVLKRNKDDPQAIFQKPVIKEHLDTTEAPNVIFILVATPVEEVGRDHDFDWAVVEPSSYRSLVQLAGRVLRHRELAADIETDNLVLMQYNFRGLKGDEKPAFCYPGYESSENQLDSHDLTQLINVEALKEKLDARPRIMRDKQLNPRGSLADLEHHVIHQLLTAYQKLGPEALEGWLRGCWWLTGLPQHFTPFRAGGRQLVLYQIPKESGWVFVEKSPRFGEPPIPREKEYRIVREELTPHETNRLWLERDYASLLKNVTTRNVEKAALIYGEISIPIYGDSVGDSGYTYCSQLGMCKVYRSNS
ncbi:MAG: type I-F CRISPR-associated helicase Cas3 [Proteobacteria bacterium]|nr:MAG: type I-F CRISPR-associated helicase Cas3 [Pseudomonadota bacterium]